MRRLGFAISLMVLAALPALAASDPEVDHPQKLTAAEANAMAGEWRAHRQGETDPCGAKARVDDVTFTLEFALTGGRIAFDDGTEASGTARVVSIIGMEDSLVMTLADGRRWEFYDDAKGHLSSDVTPSGWEAGKGLMFYQCRKPASRAAIHLNRVQTAMISSAMAGGPVLIDLRAKKGCAAREYQYLDFDLVGPLGFSLHRWNSVGLAEKLAAGGKPSVVTDEVTDFTVDKADAISGGYRFTVTERIPPNGSRGDTTTLTVLLGQDRIATIPEWKRRYALCKSPQ
jgi:hypothetical protein